MKPTIEDLKRVMEIEPSLSARGVNSILSIFHEKMNTEEAKQQLIIERKKFLKNFKGFEICCRWLSKFKQVNTPQFSSYYLKHVVERLAGTYISNGALISAAIHLKISMRFYPGWPNVDIGISKRCPYLRDDRRH